jgi:hypothetical protein
VPALPEGPVEEDQQASADHQNGSRQNHGQHLHSNGILLSVGVEAEYATSAPIFQRSNQVRPWGSA